jgi:hypothetical protein
MEVVSTTSTTNPVNMYDYLNSVVMNPMIFVIILLIIVVYYVFSSSLGLGNNSSFSISNSSSGTSTITNIMGIIIVIILVILILVNALQYFFSINLTAYITGLFTPDKQVSLVVENRTQPQENTTPAEKKKIEEKEEKNDFFSKIKLKKQVFNIPGNYYDYDNAQALCKAYNSELATYEQLEKAYNNGAEWCNYGWSANQMAFFPTQQQTYNTLQTIKGHENDCGRPGINGGYMANPRVRFGVNCYGFKPNINEKEEELMKTSTPYPKTSQEKELQKKIDYWKNKIDQILVSPFNYNIWSAS